MKIINIYKTLLTEASIEACVGKFGHVLFGDELSNGKEKNTSLEDKYADEIKDFTDNKYGEETNPNFITAIKTLKGCMSVYPEVLVPEKSKVYRGLTIQANYFIENKVIISLTSPIPYVYKARNPIQSWSDNYDAASLFGNHDTLNEIAAGIDFTQYQTPETRKNLLKDMIDDDLRIAFVVQYNTNPKEFIFKSKYFRKLSVANHEEELLRIDNKPISVLVKFNDHQDVFLTGKAMALIKYINKAIEESKTFTN